MLCRSLSTSISVIALGALSPALAADATLPALRIEPTTGGSLFFVQNRAHEPLTAYLIELVNYPGSSFSLYQDEGGAALLGPGAESKITITNMTAGAVPEYVKMQAGVYADGSTSGAPEKVSQLLDPRKALLATARELIRRIDTSGTKDDAKPQIESHLRQWMLSMEPISKAKRNSQAAINQTATRELIDRTIVDLRNSSVADELEKLKASEQTMSKSKPPLF